ncbi:hydrogenase formation protein HypD [Leptolyngbya sp. AN02str]|uniref:hydrogenase formation protein HypD n=1 Tax=Leptolyngbya sp. AN02str TaxID=3423363 RepID=UPI003D318768
MKFVDEYRNAEVCQQYAAAIARITTRPWAIMEVCGGQTHSIVKFGIDTLLPEVITLIHGPGCPVCVTPIEVIDRAIAIAAVPNVIFCSFGDMLRVPGSRTDLLSTRATGSDIRIVYSPLDALAIAAAHPHQSVVFFAVGFETTAPATAMLVYQAQQQGLSNLSLLVSHVLVPAAVETILSAPHNRVQGLLAAGHVCTVMGYQEYEPIAHTYRVPIVVTGFEPVDILQGIYACVKQLEEGRSHVENQYTRSVKPEGNDMAQQLMQEIFAIAPQQWRGLGNIPRSGLQLRDAYAHFDAIRRFDLPMETAAEPTECISGLVLQGAKKPYECTAFGTRCTPEHPLGAPMVSSEGACAAYYRYRHATVDRSRMTLGRM